MPDPIDELSNFEPGVPVSPIPAAEIRRRGEQLRRRRTALVVGGAVAAIVLIAVPVAVVAGGDDDGGTPQPAGSGLTEDALLTADEVPDRDRITPWGEITPEGQVFACAPQLPASLDAPVEFRRDFAADVAEGPSDGVPISYVRTAVMEFDSPSDARDAYDQARGWELGCPGGDNLAQKGVGLRTFEIEGGRGEWRAHVFHAADICTECDAAYFDRMGLAQFGDRLVMVSLSEIGGPLEPDGLDDSMDELFVAAVDKAGGTITGGTSEQSEQSPTRLGPARLGALKLGMTPDEIEGTGQATSTPGSRHDGYPPGCEVIDFTPGLYDELEPADPNGQVSPEQGLEQIIATAGMATPEGVRIGSTMQDVT